MTFLLKTLLRVLAVTGKELVETIRRPGALGSIVAGPFLILLVFGLGFAGQPPLRASLVIPTDAGLPADIETYRRMAGDGIQIVTLTSDPELARADLRDGAVDVVVHAPTSIRVTLEGGEQAVLEIEYSSVSPYRAFIAQTAASQLTAAVNRGLIELGVREAAELAAEAGQPIPSSDPALVAAPTRSELRNLAPSAPAITAFYGVAVLVLIVQHLAITMSALSMARDRRRGLIQLFRVSPIRTGELLLGKYLAFGFISALVSAIVVALLVGVLGVPFLGDPGKVALGIGLLIAASIGIGLVIALVSDSERQVVQLAMLVLLASVFFGGLTLDLAQFQPVVQRGAEFLPITQATRLLQDQLLQGFTAEPWRFAALAAMALVLFLLAAWRLRRALASRP